MKARALLARACELPEAELARFLKGLTGPQRRAIDEGWWAKWHKGQVPEHDDWDVWLLRGGRGFGKTRAGAEWGAQGRGGGPGLGRSPGGGGEE